MIEVEAKIRLTDKEAKEVLKTLDKELRLLETCIKKDEYYGDFKKDFLRIRTKGDKVKMEIKDKKRSRGVEMNQEIGWEVKDSKKLKKILSDMGTKVAFRKVKQCRKYKAGEGVIVEFNKVETLGYFLEIEVMVKNEKEIEEAQKKIRDTFKKLGCENHPLEKKYYLELLQEKHV